MTKQTVKMIVSDLGRDAMCEKLGVTLYALRHALRAGRFPAAWYVTVRDMCAAKGTDCSEDLFNWRAHVADKVQSERGYRQ